MKTEEPSNTHSTGKGSHDRYMIWYQDDTVDPIGVLAADRSTAISIGSKARPTEQPIPVREDEGAASDLESISDDQLSTIDHPTRFIEEVLHG